MAPLLLFILTTITTYSLSSAELSPKTDKIIPLESSITATQTGSGSSFWLSPSGHFAFGFYPNPSNPQEFIIGIWLEKSSEKPLVWQAIRSDPSLPTGSSLRLTSKGVLVQGPNSNEKSITDKLSKPVYSASILDNGNFVLLGSDDDPNNIIWESFDNPTDTLLVGQKLNINQALVSDFSKSAGKFKLQLVVNSVFHVPQLLFYFSQSEEAVVTLADVYAVVEIYALQNGPGNGRTVLYINETGALVVISPDVFTSMSGSGDFVYRAKLNKQGNFRVFAHDLEKNNTEILFSVLDNPCLAIGICGLNSYCIANQGEPTCHCPPGFNFSDPTNPYLGCERIFDIETCSGDGEKSNSTNMVPLQHTAWISTDGYDIQLMNEDECKEACSGDCYCNVAMFNAENGTCRRLNLPLKYGMSSDEILRTAFIKVGNSNSIRNTSSVVISKDRESVGKQRGLFVTGVALVICSAILLVISGFLVCHSRLRREDKIMMRMESQSS